MASNASLPSGGPNDMFGEQDDDESMTNNSKHSIHAVQRRKIHADSTRNTRHAVPSEAPKTHAESYSSWQSKTLSQAKATCSNRTPGQWVEILVPATKWLKTYEWRESLLQDVMAGCTVGAMVIPQSMSYAKLAGLPVEYGLYTAFVPVYMYAIFGSSRQLAVGPVALVSLLLSTGLSSFINENHPGVIGAEYERLYAIVAIQVSFLVGVTYVVMGLLRLGFVTIFLSHAVVSGFTSGAAIIIGLSQMKYFVGYEVTRSDLLHEVLHNIFVDIEKFDLRPFIMGISALAVLVSLKHIGKTHPDYLWVRAAGPLSVTIASILIAWAGGLDTKGIKLVGKIPNGLPSFTAHVWIPVDNLGSLMVQSVIPIAIVGFMESIAIAKKLASKHKYELDSNMELIGLGMANFMGGMFQSYAVTGSFSRSAVNNDSGAKSGLSGMVTATIVMFVLLFLTPVFEKMPLSVLGAIVVSGVLGLLDYDEPMYLWRVHKFDLAVWTAAFLGTLFLGVEIGLGIAVGVSLLIVTYESAFPHTAKLGRLPGTTVYRNIKQYPEAETYDVIVMVRIDAPIYFANTQNVREKLIKYELKAEQQLAKRQALVERGTGSRVKYIIWELSPVSHVDTSALHILHDLHHDYKSRGVQLCLVNPNRLVMEKFTASGLTDEIGRENMFVTMHDAVDWCLHELSSMALTVGANPNGVTNVGLSYLEEAR